jgi:hypothetical protein
VCDEGSEVPIRWVRLVAGPSRGGVWGRFEVELWVSMLFYFAGTEAKAWEPMRADEHDNRDTFADAETTSDVNGRNVCKKTQSKSGHALVGVIDEEEKRGKEIKRGRKIKDKKRTREERR